MVDLLICFFFVVTQYSVIALLSFYIERKLFSFLKLQVYGFAVIFVRKLRKCIFKKTNCFAQQNQSLLQ